MPTSGATQIAVYNRSTFTDFIKNYTQNHHQGEGPHHHLRNGDFVLNMVLEQIGDPKGIVSGTTKITRDPVGLAMASLAAGAKITMIIAPLIRARLPLISDRVTCISTPGATVDLLVTQKGIAVKPRAATAGQTPAGRRTADTGDS